MNEGGCSDHGSTSTRDKITVWWGGGMANIKNMCICKKALWDSSATEHHDKKSLENVWSYEGLIVNGKKINVNRNYPSVPCFKTLIIGFLSHRGQQDFFSYLTCLLTTVFILLSILLLIETIGLKIWERPLSCYAIFTSVSVRSSKTTLNLNIREL